MVIIHGIGLGTCTGTPTQTHTFTHNITQIIIIVEPIWMICGDKLVHKSLFLEFQKSTSSINSAIQTLPY